MKLHLICSKDDLRPVMNHVFIEGGVAVATNGHVIGVIADLPFDLPDGFVHREDWKVLADFKHGESILEMDSDELIKLFHKGRYQYLKFNSLEAWEESMGPLHMFPEYENLIPKGPWVSLDALGINAKLLRDLSDAIGCSRIKVSFSGPTKAIRVDSLDVDVKSYGIIMPIIQN